MIEAYKVIEETDAHIVYQYNTALTWGLFGALGIGLVGVSLNMILLQILCGLAMVAYLFIGLVKIRPVNSKLREALRSGSLKMEGSKYSFSNPLRYTLSKDAPVS
ncbi:hypothetical protein O4H49_02195 [Kiloniella laminariae]|uniref:Uncharacterized protein n=1 Tax=Kiloniella laminariae TaxID=454162 RepID=A0ABT4LF62_9PROT|nr:hypothetical protein [Kiloniella laminariae]MCZ4279570.1 hypothetical protein [Kiloniella laminariae]